MAKHNYGDVARRLNDMSNDEDRLTIYLFLRDWFKDDDVLFDNEMFRNEVEFPDHYKVR